MRVALAIAEPMDAERGRHQVYAVGDNSEEEEEAHHWGTP